MQGIAIAILVAVLLLALAKWFMWRLYFMAVLLYFAESGQELPETETIRKYLMKVVTNNRHTL